MQEEGPVFKLEAAKERSEKLRFLVFCLGLIMLIPGFLVHGILILVALYFFISLLFIRHKSLEVYSTHLAIKKKSQVTAFDSLEVIPNKEITKLELGTDLRNQMANREKFGAMSLPPGRNQKYLVVLHLNNSGYRAINSFGPDRDFIQALLHAKKLWENIKVNLR